MGPVIRTDLAACRAAGQCAYTAPALFDQDEEEGRVVVLNERPSPQELPAARAAALACPNQVIRLEES